MNMLEKLAGNKSVAQLAFRQVKKFMSEEKISVIAIFVNDKGDLDATTYSEPIVILKKSDYDKLLSEQQ